ncbi:MAG: amino acid adenylation domain-containing protein, partial [Chloroflexi bacterium]|nr:amino acid adenylation domain-containing protein [Chloroflexota bacterium]
MLAVLKAGGAFLPIDPASPRPYLEALAAQAPVDVLLTDSLHAERCTSAYQSDSIVLDLLESTVDAAAVDNLLVDVPSTSAAYVIFTSGSTGVPKGVVVERHALANYVVHANRAYAMKPSDRVLQFAAPAFDASLEEICIAFTSGACLVLRNDRMLRSAREFLERCQEWAITVLGLPSSYWHELTAEIVTGRLALPPSLRLLILGSERARPETLEAWQTLTGGYPRIVNTYGPTEATIVATIGDVSEHPTQPAREVPIGHPLPNVQIHILDGRMRPVAAGTAGEIYLGGLGVARGYIERPDLTAERFGPDPIGRRPGARLYRTGDLGRVLPNGTMEFVGRVDRQIKIRGFRVEPSTVEAVLERHPLVARAAVAPAKNRAGDTRLVAYVTPVSHQQDTLTPMELRTFLAGQLPEHMLPATFVCLSELPIAPSGKIDYSGLPPAGFAPNSLSQQWASGRPASTTETLVSRIWAEVLGVDQVDMDASFFDLGGDSLLAIRLATRLADVIGRELPLLSVFDSPTIASLAAKVDACLGLAGGTRGRLVAPAPRDESPPATFGQQGIWLVSQLCAQAVPYNNQCTIRFVGFLDIDVLNRALSEIVRRHEILRTSFPMTPAGILQEVHAAWPVHLPLVDLSSVADRNAAAERYIDDECRRPFDLTRFPLIRWTLVRLAPDDHILVQVEHHFGHDGRSRAILLRELRELYAAFRAGKPSPLPQVTVRFADYAAWERSRLSGPLLEDLMTFWRTALENCPAPLEIPQDFPRPKVRTFRGATRTHVLSHSLAMALRALARREGVTLFVVMFAAFQVQLHRRTGRTDLVTGTAVANRAAPGTENLVGMLANSLPLRSDLSDDPTFSALLRRTARVVREALEHQQLPFEMIVDDLHHSRDNSRNPFFDVMFSFDEEPTSTWELEDLTATMQFRYNGSAKFDIDITVLSDLDAQADRRAPGRTTRDRSLLVEWEYCCDLFKADTIVSMTREYETLLSAVAENSDQRISDLPLFDSEEHFQLLHMGQGAGEPFALDTCFAEQFEWQVERTPQALAVTDGDVRLTYGALNARANSVASALVARGVAAGVVVAVVADRNADLLAGILGVLKAGGAYLPLDPLQPIERLRRLLARSRARVCVVGGSISGRLMPSHTQDDDEVHGPMLSLKALLQLSAPAENVASRCAPSDLAYVMYTSGSTGIPKGAMIEQRGMLNHLYAKIHALRLTSSDTVAQIAGQSFDISVWQMLAPLLVGAQVCFLSDETTHAPRRLLEAFDAGTSVAELVPTMLAAILDEIDRLGPRRPRLAAMRWLIVTGEVLPPALCRRWLEHYPAVPVINAYGPTECSDDVTHEVIDMPPPISAIRVPIGRPIPNMNIYVLDSHLRPVPRGVVGELYVAGIGVGRGYLDDEDLTRQMFLPDVLGDGPHARMYRTGDLARFLTDGRLDYLGRVDQQIKLRGFRIEPGEIEAALLAYPGVRQTAVVVGGELPDEKCLVAYLVVADAETFSPQAIRRFLWAQVPEQMIPSSFMVVPSLPTNANGKVDLDALPPFEPFATEVRTAGEFPRTAVESSVAALWSR